MNCTASPSHEAKTTEENQISLCSTYQNQSEGTIDVQEDNDTQTEITTELNATAEIINDNVQESVNEDVGVSPGQERLEAKEGSTLEAYSYTKRSNEFTSEIFKIEIGNLPKFFGYKQFKKLLESNLNFSPVKVKNIPGSGFAFVTFRNEEERQKALTTFNKFKWKGKQLFTKPAKALPDPVASKRAKQDKKKLKLEQKQESSITRAGTLGRKRTEEDACDIDSKRAKSETEQDQTPSERLNYFVTPLWKTSYPEQIKIKFKFIKDTLQRLTVSLNQLTEEKNSRLAKEHSEQSVNLELMPCIPSPVINGYRNKCEFTIAQGPDQEKTIGFRAGTYRDGFSGVIEASECINISDVAKQVANTFQKFIRQSTLSVFDLCLHTGYWQTLTVRNTELGESMAVIQFNPQSLTQSELDNLLQEIMDFFNEKEGKECKLSSLYVQVNPTRSVGGIVQEPMKFLFGIPCIHEVLHGVKFRISPNAFFQVNIQAADKMFDIMRHWMGDCSNSTLLDICCGTGTIGLCLAKYVSKVIGIELVESAIEDAKKNAEMNDIKNAVFIAGKAEDVLVEQVLKKLPSSTPVIGIADPPRAGLHRSVIHGIRRCTRMNRLIYVACNANNAFTNLVDLCRPVSKRVKTTPFRLVKAIPIDFFPHTQHCELIMLFERDGASKHDSTQYLLSVNNENP